MSKQKAKVIIKGVKDGLIFHLDDACEFTDLIGELTYKLKNTHQQILSGPKIKVRVQLGMRSISEIEEAELKYLISSRNNLIVTSIESDQPSEEKSQTDGKQMTIMTGIVRSGQTIEHEGHLLYLGDVNPGGSILCSGDIYIMGTLRGLAHAGVHGNTEAIIAASYLAPTQLRIADIISRPPEEWNSEPSYMEFAYIQNEVMEIDKLIHLHRMRPNHPFTESVSMKGE
ncbi:MAG: septum site-determining protein MinC [Paenibacillus sp. RIFOXYA1_FULL_44_5]|nr:MAG: septum site-determining protein MinC [Paenibacillus sp. RIFOXYA1_FULL_44_5]